jgi:hypothetical protein
VPACGIDDDALQLYVAEDDDRMRVEVLATTNSVV